MSDTEGGTRQRAETVADSILRAAGSGLRHYSMHSIREGIISAAQSALAEAEMRGFNLGRDASALVVFDEPFVKSHTRKILQSAIRKLEHWA